VPGLLRHEPQGIPEHLGQIVTHQQRLVFIDGQSGVPLARRQREADTALGDAVSRHELLALLVDAELRVLQVDRVDCMAGDGHRDAHVSHRFLNRVPQDGRPTSTRVPLVHAVEIDEADRFAAAILVSDARAQRARHERQV
jgi:hypothetical protein